MSGEFFDLAGETVDILVGEAGYTSTSCRNTGGGGGGSFVVKEEIPLIVAGGGGGNGDDCNSSSNSNASTGQEANFADASGSLGNTGFQGHACYTQGVGGGFYPSNLTIFELDVVSSWRGWNWKFRCT